MVLRGLLTLAAGALVLTAGDARADDAPVGQAEIACELGNYYAGERFSGWFVGGLGAAEAIAGGVLVTRHGDFARGLGWSWLVFGGIEVLGGLGYAIGVGREIDRFGGLLAHDPAAFRAEEHAHIHGTTSRFLYYRITEAILFFGGTGTAIYGFAARKDAWKGAGIGIAAASLPIVVLDTINDARAHRYEEKLVRFTPSLAVLPGGGALGFGATF